MLIFLDVWSVVPSDCCLDPNRKLPVYIFLDEGPKRKEPSSDRFLGHTAFLCLSSYIFQLNIPSLGSPNDWRVFKYQPATNSTQSCDYRKHFAGYHVWDPNSEENHLHVTWVDLALQCVRDLESIALPSAPASLVLPCLCREVVHLHFWLVTFTSIFNFIPFHPLCWVITIIFIQILCKEL